MAVHHLKDSDLLIALGKKKQTNKTTVVFENHKPSEWVEITLEAN